MSEELVVDDEIRALFRDNPTAGYFIYFDERADLSAAHEMNWRERGRFVARELRRTADRAQRRVQQYLSRSGADFKSFWIDNVIAVESSDFDTFVGLQGFGEIAALRAVPDVRLIEPATTRDADARVFSIEPNIGHVKAPDVWALGFEGQGRVVANIDTGVRYTHETLVDQYRGNDGGSFDHNHNWWDPAAGAIAPTDGHGHGTHTMGTTIGDDGGTNQIGMAPGAQWIACRGCQTSGCSATHLLECAEFMVAPWDLNGENADPDLRPEVVNNSWGDCGQSYDGWFQGAVDAWHAAGIVPVFANGNAGNCGYSRPPGCNTVGNPARYANVLGVGSTGTSNGQYATHSNWGPTDDPWNESPLGFPNVKPNIVAPGVSVRSSFADGDDTYALGTGTSMSAPHATGLVALLWQAAPCLIGDYTATAEILMAHSSEIPFNSQCGGEGPGDVPNHATGWGEIDALAIVNHGIVSCGAQSIGGTVTRSDTSTPVEGVLIEAVGPVTLTATTEVNGTYQMAAAPGPYDLTASKDGFMPETVKGVVVSEGESVTVDFSLDLAPVADVSPSGFWFDLPSGGGDADTLSIGNVGNANLVWSITSDVPGGAVQGIRGHDLELDEPIELPDFELVPPAAGGEPVVFTLPGGTTSRGRVVGFSFVGTASGVSGSNSWASDTCLIVRAPDGTEYGVGGFGTVLEGCGENDWHFQGSGSDEDGTYESTHDDVYEPAVADLGEWTFTFVNDWADDTAATIAWSSVTITLHKAPLPVCDDASDVPWLSVAPEAGNTPPGGHDAVDVMVEAEDLSAGVFEAALCVATNDPAAEVVSVPVTLTVVEGGVDDLGFDPESLHFGEVEVGVNTLARTAVLRNASDTEVTGLTFAPPGGGFDVDTSACGDTLPVDASCAVSATFTPGGMGTSEAALEVHSAEGALAFLSLGGSGVGEPTFVAMSLYADPEALLSDGNGVLDPGEIAYVAPAWRNDGAASQGLFGVASGFDGPDGAVYTMVLSGADYGNLEAGEIASCRTTETCYQVGVNEPTVRPATHWEASVEETISDGTARTWSLHIGDSFVDVPKSSPFYSAVETLLHSGVTGGCADSQYCPTEGNTRGQMAVFLLKAAEGGYYTPPACDADEEVFADMPASSALCPWIKELADREVTAGCGGGNYCPGDSVTRAQMAVFLLKAAEGSGYTPPACTGEFSDVQCSSAFAAWIEELSDRGVTGGCGAEPPAYCPGAPVTRAQMAAFVTKTFGLTLYGP